MEVFALHICQIYYINTVCVRLDFYRYKFNKMAIEISADELDKITESLWNLYGSIVGKNLAGQSTEINNDEIGSYLQQCQILHENSNYKKLIDRGREYFDFKNKGQHATNKDRFINEFQLKTSDTINARV